MNHLVEACNLRLAEDRNLPGMTEQDCQCGNEHAGSHTPP